MPNNVFKLKQFVKKNKLINEQKIVKNILLNSDLNFIAIVEFFDSNQRLKLNKNLKLNNISSYIPSNKLTKTLFSKNKNFDNIFKGNVILLYEKAKNDKNKNQLKTILKNINSLIIVGFFINKKFYKWPKVNLLKLDLQLINVLMLFINNTNKQLNTLSSLQFKK